jgi:sulfur carrier protein ThiS
MHLGSSNAPRGQAPAAGSLPLSASGLPVEVEIARGRVAERRVVHVAAGSQVRAVLRELGLAPEGCAVLVDGTSVPLDTPIDRPLALTVVPTFSGG